MTFCDLGYRHLYLETKNKHEPLHYMTTAKACRLNTRTERHRL